MRPHAPIHRKGFLGPQRGEQTAWRAFHWHDERSRRSNRERLIDGFAKKCWTGRLAWYELHAEPEAALWREKAIKRWRRDWKIELIEIFNPTWRDLFDDILREQGFTR